MLFTERERQKIKKRLDTYLFFLNFITETNSYNCFMINYI